MGRQAYLTKIALGRSAFEPVQATSSTSEYVQLASAQQERAHEHGRRLREAQNDVLASIGVVERRHPPSHSLPGSYEERVRELEEEDTVGHTLAITSTLTENVCTWWIGSLRERLLTFHHPISHSFSTIVASERRVSGPALMYSGFPSRLLSQLFVQATVYGAHVFRPIERLLIHYRSIKLRPYYRRWRAVFNTAFRISLELLFYPFSYYSYLQRIGLVSAKPFLPPPLSFLPFSDHSPLIPVSIRCNVIASPVDFLKALVTSPFVLICLEHFFERWVYAIINAPIEATIIRPTNPDLISPEHGDKERTTAILGLRKKSPKFVQKGIAALFEFLGWSDGKTYTLPQSGSMATGADNHPNGDSVAIDGRQIQSINPLGIDVPGTQASEPTETVAIPMGSLNGVRPSSPFDSPPLSPTTSQASHNDGDPRIRITTRGNLVEMEVRLPPHVLSSHTEVAGSGPPTPIQRDIASPAPMRFPDMMPYHRVTQLSSEPSSMLGAICKAQIVSLVSLPLKLVTLRLVASHYLAGQQGSCSSRSVSDVFTIPSQLDWKYTGALISRLALCSMLELTIDLSLWGCQYLTVSWLGTRAFDWGTL